MFRSQHEARDRRERAKRRGRPATATAHRRGAFSREGGVRSSTALMISSDFVMLLQTWKRSMKQEWALGRLQRGGSVCLPQPITLVLQHWLTLGLVVVVIVSTQTNESSERLLLTRWPSNSTFKMQSRVGRTPVEILGPYPGPSC